MESNESQELSFQPICPISELSLGNVSRFKQVGRVGRQLNSILESSKAIIIDIGNMAQMKITLDLFSLSAAGILFHQAKSPDGAIGSNS